MRNYGRYGLQTNQAIDNKNYEDVLKRKFYILQLELIHKMNQTVKNKILAKGYTLNGDCGKLSSGKLD